MKIEGVLFGKTQRGSMTETSEQTWGDTVKGHSIHIRRALHGIHYLLQLIQSNQKLQSLATEEIISGLSLFSEDRRPVWAPLCFYVPGRLSRFSLTLVRLWKSVKLDYFESPLRDITSKCINREGEERPVSFLPCLFALIGIFRTLLSNHLPSKHIVVSRIPSFYFLLW